MKRLSLIFLLLCQFTLYPQLLFKLSQDSLRAFSYAGGDEFSGSQVNNGYWRSAWNKASLRHDYRYNDEDVLLKDGVINFPVLKHDSLYHIDAHERDSAFLKTQKKQLVDNRFLLHYSTAMIISREKLHYGLYELRFTIDPVKGTWPAFWFYGGNGNEEIDAFELKGERSDEIHVDTHCPYGCDKGYKNKIGLNSNWGGWMKVSEPLEKGFNIVLLEWKPGEVIWYLNGHPLAWFKGDFSNPMYVFLNNALASPYSAFQPGPDNSSVFPSNYYVDYFRVWQPATDTLPILWSGNTDLSDRFGSTYLTRPKKKSGLMYRRDKFRAEEGLVSVTMNSARMLCVTRLGAIADPEWDVQVEGQRIYPVKEGLRENQIQLAEGESTLTLRISKGKRSFARRFRIAAPHR